jgi:uncharacterized protein (TIGR00255 family)
MTGYGSASFEDQGTLYLVEIHSVNKKNLEISLYLPKDFLYLDIEIRKFIANFASRGQITLKLSKDVSQAGVISILPDKTLLKQIYEGWKEVCHSMNYPLNQLSLEFLAQQTEKFPKYQAQDREGFKARLLKSIQSACEAFLKMKHQEADHLRLTFVANIKAIRVSLANIQKMIQEYPQAQKEKIEQLFRDFDLSSSELQEKIAREVVLHIDRYDISEEIHRLQAHLQAFEHALDYPKDSVGRNLEFLVQEIHRETNTIGSKSQILAITTEVLQIKSELEKIREQVQNIE